MSTATTQDRTTTAAPTTAPPAQKSRQELTAEQCSALFDQLIQGDVKAFGRVLVEGFERNISTIRDVLPEALKPEAERFVKRAALYFQRSPKLEKCTNASKIRCVIEAAEMGLTLDGKLCHAVAYDNKYKDEKGVERYRSEVKLQLDYKGLVQVAKNSGQIVDAQARVVRANDQFKHGIKGPASYLEHTYDIAVDRGQPVGAFSRIWLPGGLWIYELMQVHEIEAIKQRSKSKDRDGNVVGPWATDWDQMAAKTVLRRQLKLYSNDPTIAKAIEVDEREYGDDSGDWIKPPTTSRANPSSLNDMLGRRAANQASGSSPPVDRQPAPPQSRETPQSREAVETLPEFGDATDADADEGADGRRDDLEPTGTQAASQDDFEMGELALHYEELLNKRDISRAENAQLRMDVANAFTRNELNQDEKGHLQRMMLRNSTEIAQRQLQQS